MQVGTARRDTYYSVIRKASASPPVAAALLASGSLQAILQWLMGQDDPGSHVSSAVPQLSCIGVGTFATAAMPRRFVSLSRSTHSCRIS